jgi:exodeoxyribonuclease VII large subunit
MNVITINELNKNISKLINNKKYIIKGVVNQPKISNGNLYLTLNDDENNIKAIIWKYKMIELNNGDIITVEGKLNYYSSSISFIIEKLIENESNILNQYELTKKYFLEKDYFNEKYKKTLPNIIKRIIIITSKTGAVIEDIKHIFDVNNSLIKYNLIDVNVQGNNCVNDICDALEQLSNKNLNKYDLILITRGGGSVGDLEGYSDKDLIEAVFKFDKLPIISAIGHQVDNPILDLVADVYCSTPTNSAQFIIDHNKNYINKLEIIKNDYRNKILMKLYNEQNKLKYYNSLLSNQLKNIINYYKNNIYNELINCKMKLNYMLKNLSEGITLYDLNDNKVNDISILNYYYMIFNNKKYKILIVE